MQINDELMQKIAEINAATEASSYLYEKDVYDRCGICSLSDEQV